MESPKIIEFQYDPNPSGIKGFYDEDVPGYIYIREDLSFITRNIVITHESQHARCHETKCSCFDLPSDFLREYHAFRAEFNYMYSKRRIWMCWNVYLKNILADLKRYRGNKVWLGHYKALAKVCRLKQFKEYAEGYESFKKIMKLVSGGQK